MLVIAVVTPIQCILLLKYIQSYVDTYKIAPFDNFNKQKAWFISMFRAYFNNFKINSIIYKFMFLLNAY